MLSKHFSHVQDLHTIDLEPYQYSGVNFTGFRLVDVDNRRVQKTYRKFLVQMGLESLSRLRVQSALIFDGVQFFARAFKRANDVRDYETPVLSCNGSGNWDYGTILSNFMRTVSRTISREPSLRLFIRFDRRLSIVFLD